MQGGDLPHHQDQGSKGKCETTLPSSQKLTRKAEWNTWRIEYVELTGILLMTFSKSGFCFSFPPQGCTVNFLRIS